MEVHTVTREMAVTHREFFRLLPRVLPDNPVHTGDNTAVIPLHGGEIHIMLAAESERRLGSLTLPVTLVTLHFSGFEADAIDDFLERFYRTFQKGGG